MTLMWPMTGEQIRYGLAYEKDCRSNNSLISSIPTDSKVLDSKQKSAELRKLKFSNAHFEEPPIPTNISILEWGNSTVSVTRGLMQSMSIDHSCDAKSYESGCNVVQKCDSRDTK